MVRNPIYIGYPIANFNKAWWYLLRDLNYVSFPDTGWMGYGPSGIFRCPMGTLPEHGGYGLLKAHQATDPIAPVRKGSFSSRLRNPSFKILTSETNGQYGALLGDRDRWYFGSRFFESQYGSSIYPAHDGGGTFVAGFADGHVQKLRYIISFHAVSDPGVVDPESTAAPKYPIR